MTKKIRVKNKNSTGSSLNGETMKKPVACIIAAVILTASTACNSNNGSQENAAMADTTISSAGAGNNLHPIDTASDKGKQMAGGTTTDSVHAGNIKAGSTGNSQLADSSNK